MLLQDLHARQAHHRLSSGGREVIFSPFEGGTATFAGHNCAHRYYGVFVANKGRQRHHVSMSAHLSSLTPGIREAAGSPARPPSATREMRAVPASRSVRCTCTRPSTATPATLRVVRPMGHEAADDLPLLRRRPDVSPGGVYKSGFTANSTTQARGATSASGRPRRGGGLTAGHPALVARHPPLHPRGVAPPADGFPRPPAQVPGERHVVQRDKPVRQQLVLPDEV